jgi:ppGpp synthetase/RelA/SpoT-type nucleotidyltranferase
LIKKTLILLCCALQVSCVGQAPKINGISFVAAPQAVEKSHIKPVLALGANYAAIMPFGFIRGLSNPTIIHNTNRQWFGETRVGAKQYIKMLQANGIKVMVKPQIWISQGLFTGRLEMASEEDWTTLEQSYSSFILEYANLAQEMKAPLFCIGTELEQFVLHRPEYWNKLIAAIRTVYNGKLIYASNWDEYKKVPFWKQLDYIGVDAYFPISENQTPSLEELKKGWQKWKIELQDLSQSENKNIVFTEFGYRSVDYAAKEPWNSDRSLKGVNHEAQINSTQALFEEVWKEDWFAGGFIWKWFVDYEKSGGLENTQFTPQNKPVEAIIRMHYGQQD